MKHLKLFIYAASFLFMIGGCKKQKEPVPIVEEPVFSFTGKINGATVSYSSGTNNYYMFSSYATNTNNVTEFIGELKNKSCTSPCTNSAKLIIKDYRILGGLPTISDSSLQQKFYNYSTPAGTANSYNVTFVPQFVGGTAQSYTWTFHDGSTSNAASPIHVYTGADKYPVCVNIKSTSNCSSSLCGNVKIGQTGNQVECGFAVSAPVGNVLSFTAQPVLGVAPYTYAWNFGDGNTSTLANPSHTFIANGVYLVTLTVTDSKNNSATFQNNVNTQSPGSCMTKFAYAKNPIANTINLGNVVFEWTDSNGLIYTSENNTQPNTSGFKIILVEEYKTNENGQKTKKIKALLNCTLYNGANSVVLDEAEIIFAVAHP